MSDERKPGTSAEPGGNELKAAESGSTERLSVNESLIRYFHKLLDSVIIRDTLKLFGWIASILIIAGLCWILTQPVRIRFLTRSVNRVLEQYGDYRRVGELSSPAGGTSLIGGSWHTIIEALKPGVFPDENFPHGTKAFIFSFVAEGTFFPCVAIVDPEGKVQEFIALNAHGKKILTQISSGILKLYIRRIEGSES